MAWQDVYLDKYYRRMPGWRDGTEEFHSMCAGRIQKGSSVLEIGAGPSNRTSEFLSTIATVVGIDINANVKANKWLAEALVLRGDRFPCGDCTFDACVSNYVMEHISDPVTHLSEVRRVLKPGGVYLFRTPNFFHYVALVSWMTPQWFHLLAANRLRKLPRDALDPYPTHYRLNSRGAISGAAAEAGLGVRELRMIEKEPMYGMSSRALFVPMMGYERLVNAGWFLEGFRSNIFGLLWKPGQPLA